jgi:hypothetical protein
MHPGVLLDKCGSLAGEREAVLVCGMKRSGLAPVSLRLTVSLTDLVTPIQVLFLQCKHVHCGMRMHNSVAVILCCQHPALLLSQPSRSLHPASSRSFRDHEDRCINLFC